MEVSCHLICNNVGAACGVWHRGDYRKIWSAALLMWQHYFHIMWSSDRNNVSQGAGPPTWLPEGLLHHLKASEDLRLNIKRTFSWRFYLCAEADRHTEAAAHVQRRWDEATQWQHGRRVPTSSAPDSPSSAHILPASRLPLPGRLGVKPKGQLRFGDNLLPPHWEN